MRTRNALYLLIFMLFLGLFIQVAHANVSVGVNVNDWAQYEVILDSTFPEDKMNLEMDVVSIQGLDLELKLTFIYEDDTEDVVYLEGEIGTADFQGFIAPANLVIGNSFVAASSLSASDEYTYYDAVIIDYEEKVVAGERVSAVIGNVSNPYGNTIISWWDKETGLLLETQNTRENGLTSITKLVDSNIGIFGSELSTFPVTVGLETFEVAVRSNSSVSEFSFSSSLKEAMFTVEGESGTTGFCNVKIPAELIWGDLSVYINDTLLTENVDYTQSSNSTYHEFQITYSHSTHVIEIRGTDVIPEDLTFGVMLLLSTVATIVSINILRKRPKWKRR